MIYLYSFQEMKNQKSVNKILYSEAETINFGKYLGEQATPSSVFCLSGDLGAGKTSLTKGIAQGIGFFDDVTSPTFSIMNIYEGGRLSIYHFDLYRLKKSDLESIDYRDFFYSNGVTIIEWPENAIEYMPSNAFFIKINILENGREIIYDSCT